MVSSLGCSAKMPLVDVAMRDGKATPREVLRRGRKVNNGAGAREQYSGEERSSERMKPLAQVSGGRRTVGTAHVPVGNDEGEPGVGNPMCPRAGRIQHSGEQPTS
jgi:hypothetical protein